MGNFIEQALPSQQVTHVECYAVDLLVDLLHETLHILRLCLQVLLYCLTLFDCFVFLLRLRFQLNQLLEHFLLYSVQRRFVLSAVQL